MKKLYSTLLLAAFSMQFASAQQSMSEAAPIGIIKPPTMPQTNALFDVLANLPLDTITGNNAKAGVCLINGEYWVSRWSADSMFTIDEATATLNSSFVIAGVGTTTSGVRAFTTDGTSIYAAINTNSIKKIDPVTKTLISSISCASTGINARSLSYDPTANGGAGGLWVSNFATDIFLIDLSGNILNTIPAASHSLTAMYGTAVDNDSPNGPFLWVFDQGFSAGTTDLVQLDVASGTPTGVSVDLLAVAGTPVGLTSSLAGGVYVDANYGPTGAIFALMQGTPSNRLVVLDLDLPTSLNEISSNNDIFLTLSPNPASDNLLVEFENYSKGSYTLEILDVAGKAVYSQSNVKDEYTNIDVKELNSGVYFVRAKGNHKTSVKKLIIQ